VTRPEPLRVDGHLGQRKERAGGQDRFVADDDGAVVERRPRGEDRQQQVDADVGVEHHAGLGDLLQARVPLEDDQRAVTLAGEERCCPGDLVGDPVDRALLRWREEPVERADAADPLERPAELRLEDDDEGEQADDRQGLEDLGEEAEVEDAGGGVDREQDTDTDHEADRARAPDQAEQPVDEERGDPDVDQRGQVDLFDDRLEKLRHRACQSTSGPLARIEVGRSRWACPRAVLRPGRSGAERDRPWLVGEPLGDEAADPIADGLVVVELGKATEQHELLDGLTAPASIEIELREEQVEVGVGRSETDRQVARIHRGR
jgi:hypothetical protein